jgi:NTP pyrophosphatase (non-canonical NTP hydrolase)
MKNKVETITTDSETSVTALRQLVEKFVADRRWHCYHDPKNLASAIAVETAELIEHFQWLTNDESRQFCGQVDADHPIAQELSDVLAYVLAMSNALQLDLSSALVAKMRRNEAKYPPPAE